MISNLRSVRTLHIVAGLTLLSFAFHGCGETGETPLSLDDPSFEISDGAHGGNAHFFFLPPMVSNPQSDGTFQAGLSPVIRITGGDLDLTLTADLDESNSHYHQNWHTDQYDLDPDVTYRISVLVDGTELGFADMDIASSGKELKNIDTGEFVALKDGRTLPIMFRIEDGALATEPGTFEVTTTAPLDEFGDPEPEGTLEWTVCDTSGSPCPYEAVPLTLNQTSSFPVDPATWDYVVHYAGSGLLDPCTLDLSSSDPETGTHTIASGEVVSLTFDLVCEDDDF